MAAIAMHLEIGGGMNPRAGFINLDQCPTADTQHDLNVLPWPVADDSCEEIYSAHCLEHLADAHTALHEICRIGVLGATVEIRVPDGDVAMIPGHTAHLSETWWRNLCQYIPASFPHKSRRLKIVSLTRNPNHIHFPTARKEFPAMGTQTLLALFPRASFEIVIVATIVTA